LGVSTLTLSGSPDEHILHMITPHTEKIRSTARAFTVKPMILAVLRPEIMILLLSK
jgi:hypothetical protein